MPNQGRRRNQKSRSNGQNGRAAGIPHPPQFVATKSIRGRARYSATGSTTSITRAALLNHLIVNTASGTANYRILSGIRLKSVQVWASAAALGASVTASVEWLSVSGPSTLHSDTSVGSAQPLFLNTSPPPQSLAGFWSYTGNDEATTLFILTAPAGAIVDITYDAVVQNGETPIAATTTNNGVVGTIYMTYLAGVTTTTVVPVSYASLT
jgi:hypothetical protein